jgi:UDP-N-acetylmuramyl pentapeptide phosphotransferase/UDP-N-acetylglucosamine-1-phosphate transferase
VFMGDSGAVPIGFLAASIGLLGVQSRVWEPLFPLMLFAMFWVDATFTLVKRTMMFQKVWQPHRDHWYQKAIRSGASHRKVLLIHLVCNVLITLLSLSWQIRLPFSTSLTQNLTIALVILIPCAFGLWAEKRLSYKLLASP